MKRLSLIIPVYNVASYLHRCLESCLAQDVPAEDYELIIVNDGSTDDSLSIAEKYASTHPSLRIHSQDNKGLSEARNAGVSLAQGEYIWFVDSDDYIAPACLGALLGAIARFEPDILVVGSARELEGTIRQDIFYPDGLRTRALNGAEVLRKGLLKSVCAPFYVVRRSFFTDGGFSFCPGIFHEDDELMPRLIYSAAKVAFLPDICYYAYSRQGSITRQSNPKRSSDLLAVASSLDSYAQGVPAPDRYLFSRHITDVLNMACKLTRDYSEVDSKAFQIFLYENRRLLRHMLYCRRLKFVLEGVLMCAFPRQSLSIYRVLQGAARKAGLSTEKKR